MLANTLKVAPPYEITDEEFLNQAEAEIRRSDKRVISEIVAIGRKLIEIKNRVGHGRYGQFIRDRLWFSERSAQQFVQSYEFLKSAHCADFESLHIDGSAVRLLARPSTPNEVRVEALERAAKPQGVSYSEVKRLIAKAEAPLKAKDETEKEASGANATDKSAALAKQTQEQEPGIAWSEERIAEPEGGAKAIAEPVHAKINTRHQGDVLPSQHQTLAPEATIKESTAPTAEEVGAGIKEPSDPPVDTELSSRATQVRKAIIHCVGAIKLTPEQCLAAETESGLAQIALGAKGLTLWLKEFNQRYAKKLKGEQLPLPFEDTLPLDDTLPLFPKATADEGHDAVTIKLVSARPRGSQDNQLCKQKRRSADRHRTTRDARDPVIVAEISQ